MFLRGYFFATGDALSDHQFCRVYPLMTQMATIWAFGSTKIYWFRFSDIDFFPKANLETIPVELGKPFSRSCTPPHSVPPARVFWIYKGAGKNSASLTAFNSINSSHIAMNDKVSDRLGFPKIELLIFESWQHSFLGRYLLAIRERRRYPGQFIFHLYGGKYGIERLQIRRSVQY